MNSPSSSQWPSVFPSFGTCACISMRESYQTAGIHCACLVDRRGLAFDRSDGKRSRLASAPLIDVNGCSEWLTDSGTGRARRQHLSEDLHRLPHFVHRSERDAAVRLLERREIAPDRHLERGARLAELARRTLQIDED